MEQISDELSSEIIEFCAENTEFTVEQVMKKYGVSMDLAFYLIKEASKKIK